MKFSLNKRVGKLTKSNWFITLFATTLGVLLALYLNNLNDKQIIEKKKIIAIENLEMELSNNEKKLNGFETNDSLLVFLNKMHSKISTEFEATSKSINAIAKEYPNFIKIIDSVEIDKTEYIYHVNYSMRLHIFDVQNIAWETSKMSNITNELSYDCLNSLVNTYTLQQLYVNEQQKLFNYFVNSEHNKLRRAISINQQLRLQLLEVIQETKNKTKKCR